MKSPLLLSAAVAAAMAVAPHAVHCHQQHSNSNSISNNEDEHERHSRRRGPLNAAGGFSDGDSVPAHRPSLRTHRRRLGKGSSRDNSKGSKKKSASRDVNIDVVTTSTSSWGYETQPYQAVPEPAPAMTAIMTTRAEPVPAPKAIVYEPVVAAHEPQYFFVAVDSKSGKSNKSGKSSSDSSAEYIEYYEDLEPGTYILPAHPKVKSGKVASYYAPSEVVYYENNNNVAQQPGVGTYVAAFPKSGKASGSKSGKSTVMTSDGYYYYYDSKSGKAYGGDDSKSGKAYGGDSKSGKAYYNVIQYTVVDIATSSPTPPPTTKTPTTNAPSQTPSEAPIKQTLILRSEDTINEYACTGKPCAITDWCRSRYGTCGPGRIYCGSNSAWDKSCPSVTESPTAGPTLGPTPSPSEEPTPFEEGVSANFFSESLADLPPLYVEEEHALLNDLEAGMEEETTPKTLNHGTPPSEGMLAWAGILGILMLIGIVFGLPAAMYYSNQRDGGEMHRALNDEREMNVDLEVS